MTPEARKALELSIEHWRVNSQPGSHATIFPEDCALCVEFRPVDSNGDEDDECSGCPVKEATGAPLCNSSPYIAAVDPFWAWRANPSNETEAAFRTAAKAEMDFLISLRDKPNEAAAR